MIISQQGISNLMKDLISAQKQFKGISKDGKGFNYNYITLDIILNLVRPVLVENKLILLQEAVTFEEEDKTLIPMVKTFLFHESGEYIETDYIKVRPVPAKGDKVTPQDIGSAITYAKRYQIVALLSLAADVDDDGMSASGNKAQAVDVSGRKWNNKVDKTHMASLSAIMKEKGVGASQIQTLMNSLKISCKSSSELTIDEFNTLTAALLKMPATIQQHQSQQPQQPQQPQGHRQAK